MRAEDRRFVDVRLFLQIRLQFSHRQTAKQNDSEGYTPFPETQKHAVCRREYPTFGEVVSKCRKVTVDRFGALSKSAHREPIQDYHRPLHPESRPDNADRVG